MVRERYDEIHRITLPLVEAHVLEGDTNHHITLNNLKTLIDTQQHTRMIKPDASEEQDQRCEREQHETPRPEERDRNEESESETEHARPQRYLVSDRNVYESYLAFVTHTMHVNERFKSSRTS